MAFVKGESGNRGGRKKAVGLSRAVRKDQGLKTWAKLIAIRDGQVKEPYYNRETMKVEYVEPGAKVIAEACRLLLSYCWGTPIAIGADELERRIMELEERSKEKWSPPW